LKQTEVDCEILKRCCESLTDENQRLKQGLVAMRRSAAAAVLYVHQFPRAADPVDNTLSLSICPSCDKLVTVASAGETSNKSSSYSDPPS
jgi:homeobox-leucine zipper protein